MTKDEARKILKQHNLWRRNQDEINPYKMCNPTELGIAIEVAIESLDTKLVCKNNISFILNEIADAIDSNSGKVLRHLAWRFDDE